MAHSPPYTDIQPEEAQVTLVQDLLLKLDPHYTALAKPQAVTPSSRSFSCHTWHNPRLLVHQEKHINLYPSDSTKAVPVSVFVHVQGVHIQELPLVASSTAEKCRTITSTLIFLFHGWG